MAAEPVAIYSARVDPDGVAACLSAVGEVTPTGRSGPSWSRLEVANPEPAGAARPLAFVHDRHRYAGPVWRTELALLRDRVASCPPSSVRADLVRATAGLRFVVTLDPGHVVDLDAPGLGRDCVLAVAAHLDGLVVTPSSIRDPRGRVLAADGPADPAATVPGAFATIPSGELLSGWNLDTDVPPDATAVARRALALAALSSRAFLEHLDPVAGTDVEMERVKLHAWVDAIELGEALEPEEWRTLQTKVGRLDPSRAVDAAWRFEGLTVLVWSLGRAEVPPDHQIVDAQVLFPAVGFLDYDASRRFVETAELRSPEEVDALGDRLALLFEQLRGLRRHKRDLAMVRTARSTLDAHVAALDGSLRTPVAVVATSDPTGRATLVETSDADVAQIENIVLERLVAATWLATGGSYAHVDVC